MLEIGKTYQDLNEEAIARWIADGWEWGKPISHEAYSEAKSGNLKLLLTPTRFVPKRWLGELQGKKVLGLASGGGQQMPLLTACGAKCTVLDYSRQQLESEKEVAEREGYEIEMIRADMSKPLPFADESFDLIVHPVSNVYVEEVKPIFKECYRVLKKGGILLCGLDNGINFMVGNDEKQIINTMPFNPLRNQAQLRQLEETDAGIEFSHSLEEQIGGQLEAGFRLTDLFEDRNGYGYLNDLNIMTFFATRAIKE